MKKNIVLSGVNSFDQRAVLTMECDGHIAKGKLRLYNFGVEPKGIISLGIYQDGSVVKAGLIRCSQMLYTFACQLENLSDDFSCAVINFVNGEPSPILYGKGEGYADKDKIFSQVIDELKETKSTEEVEETLNKYGVDYEDELKEEIEKEIDKSMNDECNNCDECIYKKYYLEHNKASNLALSDLINDEVEENEPKKEEKIDFYGEMKQQIDNLFANNPSEEYLENLLPNSKWVKVSIDDNGNYYVLGLIYEDEKLLYICYGVPGVFQKNAPRELSGFPVWFPLDENKPEGFGYWLSYQDAQSGESVKAVVV